jgi:hypothetical protein
MHKRTVQGEPKAVVFVCRTGHVRFLTSVIDWGFVFVSDYNGEIRTLHHCYYYYRKKKEKKQNQKQMSCVKRTLTNKTKSKK